MNKLAKHIILDGKRLAAGCALTLMMALCNPFAVNDAVAQNAFTQQDRELLTELKVEIATLNEKIEQLEKRMDERFEQVDKRFEQVDKRFEELRSDMNIRFGWMIALFTAMMVGTIGFALWDRRTMIRPFEAKVKEIEATISALNGAKVEKLISALKVYAAEQPKLGQILKENGI